MKTVSLLLVFHNGLQSSLPSIWGLPGGRQDLIPGLQKLLGEGNGNPRQYSCLENSMDRGACRVTVHAITKSWIQLSDKTLPSIYCLKTKLQRV